MENVKNWILVHIISNAIAEVGLNNHVQVYVTIARQHLTYFREENLTLCMKKNKHINYDRLSDFPVG